eukprot:1305195-Alexandrium_andersonii.AAC.1
MKLGRAVPPWTIPPELLRLILVPWWKNQQVSAKPLGVGAQSWSTQPEKSYRCLLLLVQGMRRFSRMPVKWNAGLAARLSKNNEKMGCDSERVILMMCSIGRLVVMGFSRRAPVWEPPEYCHGGLKARSRS